jgi:hypothetical protein
MSSAELAELLEAARRHNAEQQISGMLLYKDLSFLQVLEGPARQVAALYESIRNDPRHSKVRTLFEHAIERREFPDWTMGFQNLDNTDLSTVEGYSDVMDASGSARALFDNPSRAKKLLLLFRARS